MKNSLVKVFGGKSEDIIKAVFICIMIMVLFWINGFIGMLITNEVLKTFISPIMYILLFLVLGKVIFKVKYNGLLIDVGSRKNNVVDNLLITIIFSCIFSLVTILIYQLDFIINPNEINTLSYFINIVKSSNANISSNNIFEFISIYFELIVVVIAEEIFFRYSLYKIFVKENKDVIAFIILSSVIFGIVHYNGIARVFSSGFMGLCFAIIYAKTKSIIYPIISHLLWNFYTTIYSFFIFLFIDINISLYVSMSIVGLGFNILILIILSMYSYKNRGYIISSSIKDIFSLNIKNNIL